ncbi:MAG: sensor histidine kinase [Spirochaetaceae bacterium]|nr:MAG: sensor histidine kinase [Spirochaetaceae bacterium]
MLKFIIRHRTLITYLAAAFFAISTFLRLLFGYRNQPHLWIIIGLSSSFLALLALEPWFSRRSRLFTHLYIGIQSGIVTTISLVPPHYDYFTNFYVTLALQAAHGLPGGIAFRWIGCFAVLGAASLLYGQGWSKGLPLVIINTAAVFLIGSWMALIKHAETAREETQRLLGELQDAHRQLQLYTARAKELAVIEDRNQLARTLHDSVSQTIFSLRLTAGAARLLMDRDPVQAASQLDKVEEFAESAMIGMRTLIHELRSTSVVAEGLFPALQRLAKTLQRQYHLEVSLNVSGERDLSDEQTEQLYRIVQEALNNVIKHALTDAAAVTINFLKDRTHLEIEDQGQGFKMKDKILGSDNLGLASMRERAELLGGTFAIESRLGEGTRIKVEVPHV